MSRIMMRVRDVERPLSFGAKDGRGPLECSSGTSWGGLQFEVHRIQPVEDVGESGPLAGECGLMIVTRGGFETTLRGSRGDMRRRSECGAVRFLSGGARPHVLRIDGEAEVVAVHLANEWLDALPLDPSRLSDCEPTGGRTVETLVAAMREDVARGCAGGRLYAESLSTALLSYIFQEARVGARDGESATLSRGERDRIAGYIRDHMDGDISVTTLASLVDMPRRQFATRFRNAFGTTPHRYVVRVRLEWAARLLATGRHKISDVALHVGFCDQSHFTHAFRRTFGETPKQFARAKKRWFAAG